MYEYAWNNCANSFVSIKQMFKSIDDAPRHYILQRRIVLYSRVLTLMIIILKIYMCGVCAKAQRKTEKK